MDILKKQERDIMMDLMNHNCALPHEEPVVVRYINSGYFVNLRRAIRCFTLASVTNPRSKAVFQSQAALKRETERHLHHFYYVIHPFSDAKIFWETLMTVVIMLSVVIYPLQSYSHDMDSWNSVIYAKVCLDSICLIDIVVMFNSGYLNKKTNKVILHRKLIAKQYIKTWFIIDFICTVNIDLYMLGETDPETITTVKFINFFKLLRIFTLMRYLEGFREYRQISLYKFNFFKLMLITTILLLWSTSFMFLLGSTLNEPWMDSTTKLDQIVTCAYKVTYLFFLVGYGERYSQSNYILVFEMLCWAVGVILRFFIIAEIVQTVSKYSAATNKYHQRIQRLRDFMRNKGLPEVTCKRILQYFDFRFQKSFYREEQILSTLSQQLQQEIMLQTCQRLIENVIIFKDIPTPLLLRLVGCLKAVIYLPNDVIVQAGSTGENMYFIYNGTVAVYTSSGKEVCHLTDGSNFGEVALVMVNESRIATVIAVDSCELYLLSRTNFQKAIEPYPDLYDRICKLAQERFVDTMVTEEVEARQRRKSIKIRSYYKV